MDEDEDEVIEYMLKIQDNLPDNSVALVLTSREIKKDIIELEGGRTTFETVEGVSVNVGDTLAGHHKFRLIEFLVHGILEEIEENFESVVQQGKDRMLAMIEDQHEPHEILESVETGKIINLANFRKGKHNGKPH